MASKPEKEERWSARKKADAVVRLLRGESLDELSRDLRVEAHRLQAWRDEFLAGGTEGRPGGLPIICAKSCCDWVRLVP